MSNWASFPLVSPSHRLAPSMSPLRSLHTLCLLIVGGLLLSFPLQMKAQYRLPLTPRSEEAPLRPADRSHGARLAVSTATMPLSVVPPTDEELRVAELSTRGLRAYTFAVERPVTRATETLGELLQDPSGDYVWRAEIRAPRAKNIGLRLGKYALPEGGALFVKAKGSTARGALTSQNNSPDSLLQIAPIDAEALILEYEYPQGTSPEALGLPFRIEAVFYGFRDFRDTREADFAQPGEPFYNHPRASLASLACAPNVLAYPEAWRQSRSTLLLVVGGTTASTGALINNATSDGTPYVLTSAHCVNNLFRLLGNYPAIRRNVATTVFFFGFQSPLQRGNIRATEEQSLSGATLTAYNESTEMALLRIQGLPKQKNGQPGPIPASYQPYFAGWNAEASPVGPFVGIHHPGGSTKRYNQTEDAQLKIHDYELSYLDNQGSTQFISWRDKHWFVPRWAIGVTAPGSSGSPLFDKDGLIIGALTGGASSCSTPESDSYWSVNRAWSVGGGNTSSLKPWLDPRNSGKKTCPGYDPLSPKQVVRWSAIYPDPNASSIEPVYPNQHHQPQGGIDGLANQLHLPKLSGVKVLGAYVVFKSNSKLSAERLPQLRVSLRPFTEEKIFGAKVMEFESTSLGSFARYDETGKLTTGTRTLRSDTIELFFPAPDGLLLSLERGEYFLSCSTKDGVEMQLPLLAYDGPSNRLRGWSAWIHRPTSGWMRSTQVPGGAYWIDLLVETDRDIRPLTPDGSASPKLNAYYYADYINVEGEDLRYKTCLLEIFDLTGRLHLRQTIAPGGGRASIPVALLPEGLYIASVRPEGSSLRQGFSLYFSRR